MSSLKGQEVKIDATRYLQLLKAENELSALQAAGVDNWTGYGDHVQYKSNELQLAKEARSKVIRIW